MSELLTPKSYMVNMLAILGLLERLYRAVDVDEMVAFVERQVELAGKPPPATMHPEVAKMNAEGVVKTRELMAGLVELRRLHKAWAAANQAHSAKMEQLQAEGADGIPTPHTILELTTKPQSGEDGAPHPSSVN